MTANTSPPTVVVDLAALVGLQVEVFQLRRELREADELRATVADLKLDKILLVAAVEDYECKRADVEWRLAREAEARQRIGRHQHEGAVSLLLQLGTRREALEAEGRATSRRTVVLNPTKGSV
ncbi:MAG: hypothetical protein O3B65_00185 [Chloroflexi bacterium]|nr:hypothetical protein [Chloroflexota bacterium]